jgi:hypothetical protein
MAQYLLLFVGLAARTQTEDAVSADYNQQWRRYMGGLAGQAKLVAGAPLEPDGKVVGRDGVDDFQLQQVDVGGFIVIEADSEEEAVDVARHAPHVGLGGTTVVRPCAATG